MSNSNFITITHFLFLLISSLASPNVGVVGAQKISGGQEEQTGKGPFTAKASFIRHWKKHVSGELPKLWFLNKTSPLDGVQLAKFTKLADQNMLATKLDAFCSEANLLCDPEVTSLAQNNDFNAYGASITGGMDSFKNYPHGGNAPLTKFTDYSRSSISHDDKFNSYTRDQEFISYGQSAIRGSGDFTNYKYIGGASFTSYSQSSSQGRKQEFKTYADHKGKDTFISYGQSGTNPISNFTSYGGVTNSFTTYGQSVTNQKVDFTTYLTFNPIFKEYTTKEGVTFSNYLHHGSFVSDIDIKAGLGSAQKKNMSTVKSWVEPGKFFREEMLKTGKIMPMPDIQDKMPRRSFLPQRIVAKLPFSNGKIEELRKIFRAKDDSALSDMINNALSECERAPSPGETKHCVGSAEDMVDFATSVLGRNTVVRTTENTHGSKGDILIGSVKVIDGGKLTKSVSCHQSLFPYLLYYCHSVPNVRVYEADILNPKSKEKINQGTAICHIDTSSWSPDHGAFLELGSGPGKIEVCHWIFENDMTWTIAD